MRSLFLTLSPVLLSATLSAQGVFSNGTQVVLEKVIQDYPNHFFNIKGDLISQAVQSTRYKSTLQLPGAESTVITVSTGRQGWACEVLATKSFETARQKFADIYRQISNSIITAAGQKTFILSGQYEAPAEDRKSTCIVFSLLPGVGEMKKLRVELLMRQEGGDWKIRVTVQDGDTGNEGQGAFTSN
ncbi:MAG TPA: hypothetical protein VN616_08900 [Puia sp.]|nr:hypothetical protein [Puia sp.]